MRPLTSPHLPPRTANLDSALRGGQKLGCSPVLEGRDMASPGVEYLGVMAWAAQFQWIEDKMGPGELVEVRLGANKCRIGEKCEFVIEVPKEGEVGVEQLQAEVTGPGGPLLMEFDPREGKGSFTPREYGNPPLFHP